MLTWELTSEVYTFILFLCLKFPWKGQIQAEYRLRDYMQPSKSEPENRNQCFFSLIRE